MVHFYSCRGNVYCATIRINLFTQKTGHAEDDKHVAYFSINIWSWEEFLRQQGLMPKIYSMNKACETKYRFLIKYMHNSGCVMLKSDPLNVTAVLAAAK